MEKCPVVKAWSEDERLVARLGGEKLLDLGGQKLTRATVVANRALVAPIINHLGG
mgnify:CR=1 FL=1